MKKLFFIVILYLLFVGISFADVSNISNTDSLSEYDGCSSTQSGNYRKYQYLGQGLEGVLTQVDIKVLNPQPTYYGKAVGMEIYESDTYLDDFNEISNSNLVWRRGIDWDTLIGINGYDGIVSFYLPSTGSSYNFLPTKHYYLLPRFYTRDGGGICQSSYLYGSIDADSYKEGAFYTDQFIKDIYFNLYGLSRVEIPSEIYGYSNVLFIPGLEASRLYLNENGSENQLWEPNRNLDVEKLYLNTDGTSLNDGIYTRDIIGETNIPTSGSYGQNIYKSFSKMMDDLTNPQLPQAERMTKWEAYAYDWRQGVQDIVDNGTAYKDGGKSLIQTLEKLVASSTTKKVTIIAHSNGGLIAKALMVKLQSMKDTGQSNLIDKIDNLILIAVPQIGTASAVPAMLNGYDQAKLGGLLMTQSRARELGRNMPGAFGLLPSKEYINRVDISPVTFSDTLIPSGVTTPYINYYGNILDSYNEYTDFLKGAEGRSQPIISDTLSPIKLSTTLFSGAEVLHNKIDSWVQPESMRVINIAGWGLDTVASFVYKPSDKCVSTNGAGVCQRVLDEVPIFTVDGDKTVVEPSALYGGGEKVWINLIEYNKFFSFNFNREHKDILEIDSLNNLIKSVLQKTNIVFDTVLKNLQPVDTKNRLRISIHSPVEIGAYDTLGNFTGKICPETSDFCYAKEDIPNSSYLEFGEGKYINLPEESVQKITLQGTDIGTFTYESVKVMPDGQSATTTFIDIPVTTRTVGEVVINPNTQNPEIRLDVNNDGSIDITVQPNSVFDPISYLQIMKKTVYSLDITNVRKNNFIKRIDNTIKAIEKGKINKAVLKAERFTSILEKRIEKKDPKKPRPHKLNKVDAELLLNMLDTLLINLNK